MEQAPKHPKKQISKLRRPFVVAGAITGATLSVFYLCTDLGGATLVPDPVWVKFVNIALLMFCSIYFFNSLRRLVELVQKQKKVCKN